MLVFIRRRIFTFHLGIVHLEDREGINFKSVSTVPFSSTQPSKPSLLARALDRSRRSSQSAAAPPHDLIVMDGGIKTVTNVVVDDGGMIRHELVIEEYQFDEEEDTSEDVDQVLYFAFSLKLQ